MGAQRNDMRSGILKARRMLFWHDHDLKARQESPELALIERNTPPPRFALMIVAIVFSGFVFIQTINIWHATPTNTGQRAFGMVNLAVIAILQFTHIAPRTREFRSRYGYWTLGAQAALTLGPNIAFGVYWGGMGGFVVGSALLILPLRAALAAYVVVLGVVGTVATTTPGLVFVDIAYQLVSTTLTGLAIYGLTRLADLVAAIYSARQELARMAVARERLRFARDLHDLLGYSLSSITLKSELIHRLISHHPERAKDEVMGVLDVSRQALSDVREVARGYRDMSLLTEADSAKAVLEAADVETTMRIDCGQLSRSANTVLATVLREGVTNLLRHSQVKRCSVEVSEHDGCVRLSVVNDGVTAATSSTEGEPGAGTGARLGTGLDSLRARVAALGGRLTAESARDGTFQLAAEVPVQAADEQHPEADGPGENRQDDRAEAPAGREAVA
jgi:two-component system sensor histidine kinase DesK